MKLGTKIAIALGVAGAATAAIVMAARKPAVPPGPVPADAVPPALRSDTPTEGYSVFGWYTYQGRAPERMWIRVDKGPVDAGTVLDDIPWHWSIFVDRTDASGNVPIATGEKTWTDLGVLYRIDAAKAYAENDMAAMVARAASDQIDAMYPEAA